MAATTASVERRAYSLQELADTLGVSRSFIYNLIADGHLTTITIGRRRLIPAAEFDRISTEGTK